MPRATESKYAAVLPGLTKLPPEDTGWQAKVNLVKASITRREAEFLAVKYVERRQLKEEIDARLSEVNAEIAALEQLLAESQEQRAEGWGRYGVKDNALRLADGSTIRVQQEPTGKVVDKEAFRQWCVANGYETKLQLWPSVMNAIVKERLLSGEPEPDGTEAYSYTKVVFVKKGAE